MRLAIAILLQYPDVAQRITLPPELQKITLPGMAVLRTLFAQLKENPTLSIGVLLEHWRNTKANDHLNQLAVCTLITPVEGIEAEFLGALYQLITQNREMQIRTLQTKMNAQQINAEEKALLRKLLKEKSGI